MILTMAYLLAVTTLLGFAAHFGERICATLGWHRRGVWLTALVASVALPAVSFYSVPSSPTATPILSTPLLFMELPTLDLAAGSTVVATPESNTFSWPDWQMQSVNSALWTFWIAASVGVVLLFLVTILRVRRLTAGAQTVRIDDLRVLLSDRLGPAVFGFFRPRIVLPRWLADDDSVMRTQVIRHERSHIEARDQLALLAALLIVATMPWNLALWWQLRRLRAAIEFDCDRRVLRAGADPHSYSEALLTVGSRANKTPFAAVALTEPASELERRIRRALDKARSINATWIGVQTVAIVSLLSIASAFNAPHAQQTPAAEAAPGPRQAADTPLELAPQVLPPIRAGITQRFAVAQQCLQQEEPDLACIQTELDEIRAIGNLNTHERAQLLNFEAFARKEASDIPGAIAALEVLIELPHWEIPAGMVSGAFQSLASMYAQSERYVDALSTYDRWKALPFVSPTDTQIFFRAQLLVVLAQYNEALTETERAIASTDELHRAHYEQLYALQLMTQNEDAARATLELVNRYWPNVPSVEAPEAMPVNLRGLADNSSDYLPIVKGAPVYPPRAAQRGVEGYVIVEYTVTTTGETKDWQVIESSSMLFERAAVESTQKYKYMPRIINGTPIEVPGVRTRIEFVLEG